MPECKYCNSYESSDSNMRLARYVCSECRHRCPSCEKSDAGFPATRSSGVKYNEEVYLWCAGCGQLIPTEYMQLEKPVEHDDFWNRHSQIVGVTTTDADDAPEDARGVVDVETYEVQIE